VKKVFDPVVLGLTDRLIEATAPVRRGDHVPQPDPALSEALQPLVIVQRLQLFADRSPKQSPELIGRVRIVALGSERCFTRQAAKDEKPGIATCNRGKTKFDAHG